MVVLKESKSVSIKKPVVCVGLGLMPVLRAEHVSPIVPLVPGLLGTLLP